MITKAWTRICCQIKNRKIAFLVLCVYALAYGMTSTVLPAMVTTLEKRFDLSTSEISWLLSANDIGYLLTVLPVAYYGGRGNHVKCLVASAAGLGLSGYIMSLPYIIFGSRYTPEELLGSSKMNETSSKDMTSLTLTAACAARDGKTNASSILTTSNVDDQKVAAMALQMIGGILTGVSTSPFWNVGISFLDDIMGKQSGAFIGALYAIRCVAPILGFAFASFLTSLNESLTFFAKSYPGGEKDPFWIGAWWIGFLFLGTCVLFTAPCLALFNRKAMIERTKKADTKIHKEEGEKMMKDFTKKPEEEEEEEEEPLKKLSIKGLFQVIKSFWTNPVFVLLVVGKLLEMIAHVGIFTFFPKFIEFHFRMTASEANMMSAIVLAGSAIVATTGSGLISRKFPMSPKGNNFFHAITNFISAVLFPLLLLFVCPTIPIMGSDNKSPNFDCAPKNCSCPFTYKPVCVDNQNYFSACQAGCDSFNASSSTYSNCLCKNVTATPGVCGGACGITYGYGALLFAIRVIGIIAAVQSTQLLMSLGKKETKPFGLATISFLYGITGMSLPPIAGKLISSMCLVRNPSATGKSFCVLYNVDKMRVVLHMMSFVPQLVACVFYFLSWYKTPRETNHDKEEEQTDTLKDATLVNGSLTDLSPNGTAL